MTKNSSRLQRRTVGITTLRQSREAIFAPTRRPPRAPVTRRFDTPSGFVDITGRLGQRHRDVLDALLSIAEDKAIGPDSKLYLIVDPHKLRKAIARTGGGKDSHEQTMQILKDLRSANIDLHENGERIIGGILEEIVDQSAPDATGTRTRTNPGARLPEKPHTMIDEATPGLGRGAHTHARTRRRLLGVSFSRAWMRFIRDDYEMHYNLSGVCALTHGVSAATARWILTHDPKRQPNGGWFIDTALHAVGVPDGQSMRDARRRLLSDAGALADLGIRIDEDRRKIERVRRGAGDSDEDGNDGGTKGSVAHFPLSVA